MKEVKLLQLELTNYRNIQHEVYDFGGCNAKIIGENRIGKTNTLEAIYFLLTNYLLDGSSDLTQLKPLEDTKRVVSVRGVFSVWETATPQIPPVQITIEKKYAEDWVKTRGKDEIVLKGHYEEYYFNDIKQDTSGQYYELLEEQFGVRNDRKNEVDIIQTLCNPLYIGNLGESKDWTELRKFIIKLIGDVTNEEIFAKEPKTEIIKEDLERALGKVEQVKKMYDTEVKSANDLIASDEAQIALLEKTPQPKEEDVAIAKKGLEDSTATIGKLMSAIDNNSVISQMEKEYVDLKNEVLTLNTKEYSEYQKSTSNGDNPLHKENEELNELLKKRTDLTFELSNASGVFKIAESHLGSCDLRRQDCIKRLRAVREQIANADNEIQKVCPTCGRPLDEDKIAEAKQKYVAQLQEKEQSIIAEGKANTEEKNGYIEKYDKAKAEVDNYQSQIDDIQKTIAEKRDYIKGLEQTLLNTKNDVAPYIESQQLQELRKKLAEKEKELQTAKADESAKKGAIYQQIEDEKAKVINYQKVVDEENYYRRQMALLDEIEGNLKSHRNLLAFAEQKREALQLFNHAKFSLLDSHIRSVFGNIKFQLIKENLNGGFDPICKPLIYDVEKGESTKTMWKSGSKSERIVTGIAIAEAIKNKLGLSSLPYLFDEGGEISTDTFNNRLQTQAQIICAKVEDNINKPLVVKM